MSNVKYLLTIVPVMAILLGCSRRSEEADGVNCTDNCLTLTGRLVEQQSGNGLGGTELQIYFDRRSTMLTVGGRDYIGKTTTSNDGRYSFVFSRDKLNMNGGYVVIAGKRDGYVNRFINSNTDLTTFNPYGVTDTIVNNLELWKAVPLKLRVIAASTSNFNSFYWNQSFATAFSYNNSISGNRTFDETINLQTGAGLKTYIPWGTLGNVQLQGIDSITIPDGGSGNVTIRF